MIRGGVEFPDPPKKEKWGSTAKFADPDGNIFWLLEVPTAMVRATLNSRAPKSKRVAEKRRARPRKR
jgi:hypothetical protein